MSEGIKYPSQMEIARSLGRATQVHSQILNAPYGCAPTSVAFTHEYGDREIHAGLVPIPFLDEVEKGAGEMAIRFGQEVIHKATQEVDIDSLTVVLRDALESASSAWILYHERHENGGSTGHMISIIAKGPNIFARWDLADQENHFKYITLERLAQYVHENRVEEYPDVDIFSFVKN